MNQRLAGNLPDEKASFVRVAELAEFNGCHRYTSEEVTDQKRGQRNTRCPLSFHTAAS
jgi:hypothetical protein